MNSGAARRMPTMGSGAAIKAVVERAKAIAAAQPSTSGITAVRTALDQLTFQETCRMLGCVARLPELNQVPHMDWPTTLVTMIVEAYDAAAT